MAAAATPEKAHPFTTPVGSDASMFIQWKGTEVCLDFYCDCGERSHVDAEFAYYVQCPRCEAVYEMGTQVIAKRVDLDAEDVRAVRMGRDDD